MDPTPSVDLPLDTDALAALQLRVARRADELARMRRGGMSANLLCWLSAEAEILGQDAGTWAKMDQGAAPS